MSDQMTNIIDRIKTAIDSDDVLAIALFAESNLTKVELMNFKSLLKEHLKNHTAMPVDQRNIKQLLDFLTFDYF